MGCFKNYLGIAPHRTAADRLLIVLETAEAVVYFCWIYYF